MRELIREATKGAAKLQDVQISLVQLFPTIHPTEATDRRIGYVAGIINSEGPQFRERNIIRLGKFTEAVRKQSGFPVFSAVDVFYSEELYKRISGHTLTPQEFMLFWREILGCGHITDVFFTPKWDLSLGARDEHETAEKFGIRKHYVEEDLILV